MSEHDVRMVECVKLHKQAPGLKRPPIPGELGQQIYASISQEAWQQWLQRQTMFINEYHLNLTEFEARQFLQDQMQAFLFADEDSKPAGYVAEEKAEKLD